MKKAAGAPTWRRCSWCGGQGDKWVRWDEIQAAYHQAKLGETHELSGCVCPVCGFALIATLRPDIHPEAFGVRAIISPSGRVYGAADLLRLAGKPGPSGHGVDSLVRGVKDHEAAP